MNVFVVFVLSLGAPAVFPVETNETNRTITELKECLIENEHLREFQQVKRDILKAPEELKYFVGFYWDLFDLWIESSKELKSCRREIDRIGSNTVGIDADKTASSQEKRIKSLESRLASLKTSCRTRIDSIFELGLDN